MKVRISGNLYPECRKLMSKFLTIKQVTGNRFGVVEFKCKTGFGPWKKDIVKYKVVKCIDEIKGEYLIIELDDSDTKLYTYEAVMAYALGILEGASLGKK